MFADFRIPPEDLDLPTQERELASVIGRSAAIRLSWRVWQLNPYQGSQNRGVLYVPGKLTEKFIARVGNEEVASALIGRYAGNQLELTGCHGAFKRLRLHAVRKLIAHGARRRDVMLAAGMCDRQVRRICEGIESAAPWPAEQIARHLMELDSIRWLLCQNPLKR